MEVKIRLGKKRYVCKIQLEKVEFLVTVKTNIIWDRIKNVDICTDYIWSYMLVQYWNTHVTTENID
jgi:hypothetical protein